jgi:dimeric dUTPase (all-alpha-NTP-PPase superfamily)
MTRVIFRKFKEGDIIALFPDNACTQNICDCESYMHIGQHGAASVSIVNWTKPASKEEYQTLYQELISIGYDLELASRFSYKSMLLRREQVLSV